jgi:hypothetical protein
MRQVRLHLQDWYPLQPPRQHQHQLRQQQQPLPPEAQQSVVVGVEPQKQVDLFLPPRWRRARQPQKQDSPRRPSRVPFAKVYGRVFTIDAVAPSARGRCGDTDGDTACDHLKIREL